MTNTQASMTNKCPDNLLDYVVTWLRHLDFQFSIYNQAPIYQFTDKLIKKLIKRMFEN
jgi:hypothetical protein